jgi:hypothetical protein
MLRRPSCISFRENDAVLYSRRQASNPDGEVMTDLMTGFPPSPQGQVTLANWRTSPFNRWAFQHVREIVPSADISHSPLNALPRKRCSQATTLSFGVSG